jgi:hypothetical protein
LYLKLVYIPSPPTKLIISISVMLYPPHPPPHPPALSAGYPPRISPCLSPVPTNYPPLARSPSPLTCLPIIAIIAIIPRVFKAPTSILGACARRGDGRRKWDRSAWRGSGGGVDGWKSVGGAGRGLGARIGRPGRARGRLPCPGDAEILGAKVPRGRGTGCWKVSNPTCERFRAGGFKRGRPPRAGRISKRE